MRGSIVLVLDGPRMAKSFDGFDKLTALSPSKGRLRTVSHDDKMFTFCRGRAGFQNIRHDMPPSTAMCAAWMK